VGQGVYREVLAHRGRGDGGAPVEGVVAAGQAPSQTPPGVRGTPGHEGGEVDGEPCGCRADGGGGAD
jgi:hypothetical protein